LLLFFIKKKSKEKYSASKSAGRLYSIRISFGFNLHTTLQLPDK